MEKVLLVGVGGFLGASSRYLLGLALESLGRAHNYPYGILAVNVLGCFAIGLFCAFMIPKENPSESLKVFVVTGLLGGFTTFSSFGMDTLNFLQNQQPGRALLNISLNVILGIAMVYGGYLLGAKLGNSL